MSVPGFDPEYVQPASVPGVQAGRLGLICCVSVGGVAVGAGDLDLGGDAASTVVAVLFGAVACGLGVLALTAGLQRMWRGHASQNWPTTQGVVVFSMNGEDAASNDTDDPTYYSQFVYQYEVAGTKHFNNVRQFAQVEGGSSEDAARIASTYQKGAIVKVSYFPTDPDVAVLEPGNTNSALVLPGIGAVLLLFSLAIFIWVVPAVSKP